jgi:signal peptidase II
MIASKTRLFWPLAAAVVLADGATKRLAVTHLAPYVPLDVFGDLFRFTLAYNTKAAIGLSLGPDSRIMLIVLTIAALAIIGVLYRRTNPEDWARTLALALVCGGAVGNLVDRVRSAQGVVDFIDMGLGSHRFWTFNVADIGVSVGAFLLAAILWRDEEEQRAMPSDPSSGNRSEVPCAE